MQLLSLRVVEDALSEIISAKVGDGLCVALGAELKEMQERIANRHIYEASERAYVLSGLSSHSWQRSTDNSAMVSNFHSVLPV